MQGGIRRNEKNGFEIWKERKMSAAVLKPTGNEREWLKKRLQGGNGWNTVVFALRFYCPMEADLRARKLDTQYFV